MDSNLSRRVAMAALVTGVAVAAAPMQASAALPSRSSWDRALTRYRRLSAAFTAANKVNDDAMGEYFERRPDRPTFVMEIEGDYGQFGKHVLPIHLTHEELDDPKRRWRDPARIEAMRAELAEFRRADAALRGALNLDALEAAERKASRAQTTALRALLVTAAPDPAALKEKLQIALDEYEDDDGRVAAVLADVTRLFAGGSRP